MPQIRTVNAPVRASLRGRIGGRGSKAVVMAVLFAAAANLDAEPPMYVVTDLGTFGGELANAFGINEAGDVVGQAELPNFAAAPFLWQDGTLFMIPGLTAGNGGRADGVNDLGHVVGSMMAPFPPNPDFSVAHAFFWSPQTGTIDLTPDSTAITNAKAINNSGQIVGAIAGGPQTGARLWTIDARGQVHATVIALPGAPQGFSNGANDINEHGVVVGAGFNANFNLRAWRWDPETGAVELGTLGGTISEAFGINDAGQIVGSAQGPSGPAQPVLWDAGEIINLGLLPHPDLHMGEATAINNHGEIVGTDRSLSTGLSIPWVRIDDVKYALPDLLAEEDLEEWDLRWAFDINDAGQIVGIAIRTIDGIAFPGRAFLLTPISDAVPGDLNGDGIVNVIDLLILLGAWGECPNGQDCAADLNNDGTVDIFDLLLLLSFWS